MIAELIEKRERIVDIIKNISEEDFITYKVIKEVNGDEITKYLVNKVHKILKENSVTSSNGDNIISINDIILDFCKDENIIKEMFINVIVNLNQEIFGKFIIANDDQNIFITYVQYVIHNISYVLKVMDEKSLITISSSNCYLKSTKYRCFIAIRKNKVIQTFDKIKLKGLYTALSNENTYCILFNKLLEEENKNINDNCEGCEYSNVDEEKNVEPYEDIRFTMDEDKIIDFINNKNNSFDSIFHTI